MGRTDAQQAEHQKLLEQNYEINAKAAAKVPPPILEHGVLLGQLVYLHGTNTLTGAIAHSGCLVTDHEAPFDDDLMSRVNTATLREAEVAKREKRFVEAGTSLCEVLTVGGPKNDSCLGVPSNRQTNCVATVQYIIVCTRASTRSVIAEYTGRYGPASEYLTDAGTVWLLKGAILQIKPMTMALPQHREAIHYTQITWATSR